jgi:hypothetical protein
MINSSSSIMRQLMDLFEASGNLKKGDKIQPDQMAVGDMVELNSKTLVVISIKYGRKFFEISLLEPATNKSFTWKPVIGRDTQQSLIYLGKSSDDDVKAGQDKKNDRANKEFETLRANQDILDKLNLKTGQEVLIKFRNGPAWKTVEGVDYKTGQVSVVDDYTLTLNPDYYRNPNRTKRKLIPANYIVDVREGSETHAQKAADFADKLDQNKEKAATKRALRKMWQ